MRKIWTADHFKIAHDLYEAAFAAIRSGKNVKRSDYVRIGAAKMDRTEGSLRWFFGNMTVAREELALPTVSIFGRADHRAEKLIDWYREQAGARQRSIANDLLPRTPARPPTR